MRFVLLSKCQRARFPRHYCVVSRGGKKRYMGQEHYRTTYYDDYNGVLCAYYRYLYTILQQYIVKAETG